MSSRSRSLSGMLAACGGAMLVACGGASAPPAPVQVVLAAPIIAPPPDPCAQAATRILGGLHKPLTLVAYVSRGTSALDAFVQELRALLDEQQRLSVGKLVVRVVEDASGDDRQRALDDGVMESTFGEADPAHKNRAQIVKGFLGIVLHEGSEKEAIPVFSPDDRRGLAFWILNKIREIDDRVADTRHPIGLLTGHDEIALSEPNLVARNASASPSMRKIMEQALPFFGFHDVDLQDGEAAIDPSLTGLIITQPGKELTRRELRRIDQFLMLGNKTLVVYAGAVNVQAGDATLTATLGTHGLEKLLDGYGIEMKQAGLLDWGSPMRLTLGTDDKKVVLPYPPILHAEIDTDKEPETQGFDRRFPGFFRLEELVFPFASPLVPHPDRQPGATMHPVARSSAKTTQLTRAPFVLALTNEWRPEGTLGAQVIGVVVEGKLRSAFGAGNADGVKLPAETQDGPSRVFVLASSQFLTNPLARAGNPPPQPPQMAMMGEPPGDPDLQALANPYAQKFLTGTILSFKTTLDWMVNGADLNACALANGGAK